LEGLVVSPHDDRGPDRLVRPPSHRDARAVGGAGHEQEKEAEARGAGSMPWRRLESQGLPHHHDRDGGEETGASTTDEFERPVRSGFRVETTDVVAHQDEEGNRDDEQRRADSGPRSVDTLNEECHEEPCEADRARIEEEQRQRCSKRSPQTLRSPARPNERRTRWPIATP